MIHEIYPHRFNNQYNHNAVFGEKDYVLNYRDSTVLLKIRENGFELPQKKDLPEISVKTSYTYLFSLNEVSCFLVWDKLNTEKNGLAYKDIHFFRSTSQHEIAWICLAGLHLMNWYLRNRYCGKCGAKTQQKPDERALICPECDTTVYTEISPAIIVALTCKDKILLARNTNFPVGWYSLVAGYADIGESLEETVIREVKEEVGLDVRNIRYYKSQPWPLSGSLMIGFIAEADQNQPIVIDEKEIAEAAWFTRGNLPEHPPGISIGGEMIEKFNRGELG